MKTLPHPYPHQFRVVTLMIAISALFGGCSTSTYVVQVDAISEPPPIEQGSTSTAQPASYRIDVTNPNIDETSLRYKEVTNYVKTSLSGKGLYEDPRPEKAEMIVNIDYGVDSPRLKFVTVNRPVYAMAPGRVVSESVPILDKSGNVIGYREVTRREPDHLEFIGMEENVKPVVVYEKFLKISARANKEAVEGRPPDEIWSVNVSLEDDNKELRKYLPILASATADYIGSNTRETTPVKINEKDEVVGFIKKGI